MSESRKVPIGAVKGAEALAFRVKQSKETLAAIYVLSEVVDKNMETIEKKFDEFSKRLDDIEVIVDILKRQAQR